MISKVFRIAVIGIIIVGLLYTGTCVYANFIQSEPGTYKLPKITQAQYEVTIVNTNNILFTDEYTANGSAMVLHGYWELTGTKYKEFVHDIVLDQNIFGTINIKLR